MKSVSGKELCKALEKKGWTLNRITGSHHIYTKPGVDVVLSVPVHGSRTLRTGTQRSLMKAADLSEHDL
jgi:predicted RNA binding protein YcfA (HicA-like mRNA interferase family)